MVDVLSLLAAIGGLGGFATVIGVAYWIGKRFAEIDARFNSIDEKFRGVDERFRSVEEGIGGLENRLRDVEKRLSGLEERIRGVEEKLSAVEKRLNGLEERIGGLENRLNAVEKRLRGLENRFSEFEERVSRKIDRFANAFTFYQEFFVEFLTREGVLRSDAREILIREVHRVTKLALTNPLTKEEWEKLKEYIEKSEKDELTSEEADEFLELARKELKSMESIQRRGNYTYTQQ